MTNSISLFSNKVSGTENANISISRGPQFSTPGGTYLAMVCLMFLVLALIFLVHAQWLVSLLFASIFYMLFSLVVDVHGIEVDPTLHQIRDYKSFIWFRIGKWHDLNLFKSIYLKKKSVTARSGGYSEYSSNTYHYYHIILADESNKIEIILAEYNNYYKARNISESISFATGLVLKDFLKSSRT